MTQSKLTLLATIRLRSAAASVEEYRAELEERIHSHVGERCIVTRKRNAVLVFFSGKLSAKQKCNWRENCPNIEFTNGIDLLVGLDETGLLTTPLTVEIAVVCAEHVFGNVPKENKKNCRKAIKAAKDWLADPSKKNRLKAKRAAAATLQDINVAAAWGASYAARTTAELVFNDDLNLRTSALYVATLGDEPESEDKWQAQKIIKILEKKGIDTEKMRLDIIEFRAKKGYYIF